MIYITTTEKLNEIILSSDGVVCMGAGRYAEKIKTVLSSLAIDKILHFVDSDKSKHYTNIYVGEKSLQIYPVVSLKQYLGQNIVVLITTWQTEVMEYQLQMLDFSQFKTFSLPHSIEYSTSRKALKKYVPRDLKIYSEPQIPKVIHYCWFGKNPVPDRYKIWMESWQKYCPDYEVKLWNEDNYDVTKNKYMLQAYEAGKWGFVPDYARMDIIYNYGGIYLDTDVEVIQPLDDLLYQDAFLGFERNDFVNLGQGFGAVKGHPIIKEMRDMYEKLTFVNEDGTLNLTPSPAYQTEVLVRHGLGKSGSFQIIDNVTVYPEKLLNGKNERTRIVETLPCTKMIHHFDASWHDSTSKYAILNRTKYFQNIYSDNEGTLPPRKESQGEFLTVIVPVYNCSRYLNMCVDSIIKQEYENLEIILVDDGSTDESGAICDSYMQKDLRVKVIHKENGGLVSARVAGVMAATAEYVTFVDGDDWINEKTYSSLMGPLINSGADLITYGCFRYWEDTDYKIDVDETITPGFYDKKAMAREIIPRMLFDEKTEGWALDPSLCMKIFKKELLEEEYSKMGDRTFYFGEDTTVIYPLLLKCDSIFITHNAHYYHRQRPRYVRTPYFSGEKFYDDLYELYSYLKQEFQRLPHWELMKKQLDCFYIKNVDRKKYDYQVMLGSQGGAGTFSSTFLFPFNKVDKGTNVALYGAGKVGHNFRRQLDMTGYCQVAYWIDQSYREEGVIGLDEFVGKADYDYVVIALASDAGRAQVKADLKERGVPAEKIIDYVTHRL